MTTTRADVTDKDGDNNITDQTVNESIITTRADDKTKDTDSKTTIAITRESILTATTTAIANVTRKIKSELTNDDDNNDDIQ